MMKKYIGITLITASMLVMGCSSDDDAADMTDAGMTDAGADAGATDAGTDAGATDAGTDAGATDAGTDAGATDAGTDAGATDGGATNSYRATSIMGVMSADARLTTLASALNPDFDQPLDTANQGWTVFAPTNDALAAAIDGGAVVTGTVLQSHIYTQGAVASSQLNVGDTVSMSNNSVYTITAGANGGLQINGVDIIEADLAVDNGALHIIDGVLLPNN